MKLFHHTGLVKSIICKEENKPKRETEKAAVIQKMPKIL